MICLWLMKSDNNSNPFPFSTTHTDSNLENGHENAKEEKETNADEKIDSEHIVIFTLQLNLDNFILFFFFTLNFTARSYEGLLHFFTNLSGGEGEVMGSSTFLQSFSF